MSGFPIGRRSPKRRPGDRDQGSPRSDPNAEFLGQHSTVNNNAGLDFVLVRIVRWLLSRRSGR